MKTNLIWLFIFILLSTFIVNNVQSKKKSRSNVIVINNSGKISVNLKELEYY